MDNPYDKSARDEFQKATGEEPLFDVAYYDGHYYVSRRAARAHLCFLPVLSDNGRELPTAIGVLICCILFHRWLHGTAPSLCTHASTSNG